jgi:hypothetical protein
VTKDPEGTFTADIAKADKEDEDEDWSASKVLIADSEGSFTAVTDKESGEGRCRPETATVDGSTAKKWEFSWLISIRRWRDERLVAGSSRRR